MKNEEKKFKCWDCKSTNIKVRWSYDADSFKDDMTSKQAEDECGKWVSIHCRKCSKYIWGNGA